jgi:predicted enzyme related to lactoylglutathione lyase
MTTATKTKLSTATVMPVLPAVDIERAKRFYGETLGLDVQEWADTPGYLTVHAGSGSSIVIYQRERTKAEHTVAGFVVDDIESVIGELRSRGVVFEEYDMPGMKTVDGIVDMGPAGKSAWFTDSEGNIISISQM